MSASTPRPAADATAAPTAADATDLDPANDNISVELAIVGRPAARDEAISPVDRFAERGSGADVVDLDEDLLAEALKRPENARALARILLKAARVTTLPAAEATGPAQVLELPSCTVPVKGSK